MKEIKVSVNTWYVVEGTAGATVTNPSTNRVIATIEDGKQASFYATTPYVLASDDSVSVYKTTFNSAPAKLRLLGLLGGGASAPASLLPAGYIAAAFLESSGTQYILTDFVPTVDFGAKAIFSQADPNKGTVSVGGVAQPYFVMPRYYQGSQIVGGMGQTGPVYITNQPYDAGKHSSALNYKNSKRLEIDNIYRNITAGALSGEKKLSLFAFNDISSARLIGVVRIYEALFTLNENEVGHYIPAVDAQGEPCMYDKASTQPYYNSGSGAFIVGMTLSQARKLATLPATGGKLTISLPSGYDSDADVMSALETARSNGWTLTVQTYEAETAAATFGMRRIWVRRTADEHGAYVDADGTRWHVDWCVDMLTPDNSTPDAHGYERFRSVDAAVEYWELQPWVDPEAEKLLTEYNANE